MTTNRYPFGPARDADPPPLDDAPPVAAVDAGRRGVADALVSTSLGAIAVLWAVLPLLFVGVAIVAGLTFGAPRTPKQSDDMHTALALAAVALVGLPALGLGVGLAGRRRGATWFYGAALALGATAVVGLAVAGRVVAERRPAPPPAPPPVGCQELSGGGNDCPGG